MTLPGGVLCHGLNFRCIRFAIQDLTLVSNALVSPYLLRKKKRQVRRNNQGNDDHGNSTCGIEKRNINGGYCCGVDGLRPCQQLELGSSRVFARQA